MIINLKFKIEEVRLTQEALNKLLIDKDKDSESLKIEVVYLRKKLQESNMNSSSKIVNQIISCQRYTNDNTRIWYATDTTNTSTSTNKTRIGYKLETTDASTSTSFEKT